MSEPKYRVVEGVGGVWHYHLAPAGRYTRGLCGAQTMTTEVPLSAWGVQTHLHERWCDRCKALSEGDDVLRMGGECGRDH